MAHSILVTMRFVTNNQIINKLLVWIKKNKIFIITCCIGLLTYLLISITKHLHFNSTGYDLVIFDQAVRHYSEFKAPASSFRGFENLLGDHFHPILILLAPLYWIYSSPYSLLVSQAVLFISACLPIYLYAKSKVNTKTAIFLVIAFIFNAALLRAVYFDFHEIAFAVPLIAWAIYFIYKKQWIYFYVAIALLLLVKEDVSVLVAFFGIYLLTLKQYKHGVVTFFVGVVWFFLVTKLFIPYFAGTGKSFNYWSYDQLGKDLPSSLLAIVKNPLFAISLLFTPFVKVITFVKTFGVFLGLTFFSPIIILAIPLVLERFLSSTENYWEFFFHYGATLSPILVMAVADGLSRIYKTKLAKKPVITKGLQFTGPALATIAVLLFLFSPMNFILKPSNYSLSTHEKDGYALLDQLPEKGSFCTSTHLTPHLGKYELTLIGFNEESIVSNCTYILVSEKIDFAPTLKAMIVKAQQDGYREIKRVGSWALYEK